MRGIGTFNGSTGRYGPWARSRSWTPRTARNRSNTPSRKVRTKAFTSVRSSTCDGDDHQIYSDEGNNSRPREFSGKVGFLRVTKREKKGTVGNAAQLGAALDQGRHP